MKIYYLLFDDILCYIQSPFMILHLQRYKTYSGYLFFNRIEAKGIWKQEHEANIWTQERWEWGVEKAPQWGTSFVVCTVHLI